MSRATRKADRIILMLAFFLLWTVQSPAQWPTLHRDYQRSGHTDQVVEGPYERKWWRDFHDEIIATRCEAIVAEGKVFVGTFAGKCRALDVDTGKTLWTHQADGPIGASPCYHEGKLYVVSDDAFNQGTLACLDAENGRCVWKYRSPAGLWASPACDGKNIYVGDRSGKFHAVDVSSGEKQWTFSTGYMILKPASFSVDGRKILFGSEDMHVYCLTPSGKLLWKSEKLAGLSLRDQGPTIWSGLAIVRTNPADPFHKVLGRNGETLEAIQREIPRTSEDAVLLDKWSDLLLAPRPDRRNAENRQVTEHLKEHPHDQSFYAFDLEDGRQPWIAPIFYTCGLHNPPTPPTFDPETGHLYTLSRSALTYYVRGVRRYSCLVRLDRQTGRPDWVWPEEEEENWRHFPMIPDETQALGMMGKWIVGTHQGVLGAIDPASGSVMPIWPARDTYAGIFGPGAVEGKFDGAKKLAAQGYLTGMPNEWHGPDRAIVSIAENRLFWIAGSQVVCIGGPDLPATETGGTEPPPPIPLRLPPVVPGGNVSNRGQGKVEKHSLRRMTPEQLTEVVDEAKTHAEFPDVPRFTQLQKRLESEIGELIAGKGGTPWAPLVVQLGISRHERHFHRTGETLRILAMALPYLSKPRQQEAIAYLDRLVEAGSPLEQTHHDPNGARREPFLLGPEMREFATAPPRVDAEWADLYALWAYAHFADRWEAVSSQRERITKLFDEKVEAMPEFDPDDMEHDACRHLNRRIAGLIGSARLFKRWDDQPRYRRALEELAQQTTLRVHHERSDHRLVRPTKGETHGIHQASVPRYIDLVPEVARLISHHSGKVYRTHLTDLRAALPLWYQTYGERMIGGENYISPPNLSRGIFLAWADGTPAASEALAAKLDQPWCRADLYDIEKTTALLRGMTKKEVLPTF